ncbi:MAG: fluoride efflux transporter CrcB [Alphaproteobacteria bacterium]|nr:fluoride efflux transporter CrcB [Alphaproteobacteria bacterium]
MLNFLVVAIGGAAGAVARYGVSLAVAGRSDGWPWPTFAINVSGSLLIGVLAGWFATRQTDGGSWALLLGTGVLGGFTTFSAYSLETAKMMERADWWGASSYSLGSIAAGLAAALAGLAIARRAFA